MTGLLLTDITEKRKRRFWSKVAVRGPDDCWLWTGHRDRHGYGKISILQYRPTASRFSLMIAENRVLVSSEFACHKCANPPCCNPNHLFVGSMEDNINDARAKGLIKSKSGEGNPGVKLTADQVMQIFHLKGGHATKIASQFGVTKRTISSIWFGSTWSHLTGAPSHAGPA